MAKLYSAPRDIQPPQDYNEGWREREAAYEAELVAWAKSLAPGNPLVGKIIKFPVADSYARYMVVSTKPLGLVAVGGGDFYQIPAAHMRGLNLSEVKKMVAWEENWKKVMSERKVAS